MTLKLKNSHQSWKNVKQNIPRDTYQHSPPVRAVSWRGRWSWWWWHCPPGGSRGWSWWRTWPPRPLRGRRWCWGTRPGTWRPHPRPACRGNGPHPPQYTRLQQMGLLWSDCNGIVIEWLLWDCYWVIVIVSWVIVIMGLLLLIIMDYYWLIVMEWLLLL